MLYFLWTPLSGSAKFLVLHVTDAMQHQR